MDFKSVSFPFSEGDRLDFCESKEEGGGFEMKDHHCAICFNIMFEPTTLPCAHSFCLNCTKAIFKVKYSLKCPMCRTPLPPIGSLTLNQALKSELAELLPEEFHEFEEIRAAQKEFQKNHYKITLQIGNTHEFVDPKPASSANRHKWSIFVRPIVTSGVPIAQIFSKVVFKLHKTYRISEQEVRGAPFNVTRCGHSPFTAGIVLHFPLTLGMKPMTLSHTLVFGQDEKKWEKTIYLPKRKVISGSGPRGPPPLGKKAVPLTYMRLPKA